MRIQLMLLLLVGWLLAGCATQVDLSPTVTAQAATNQAIIAQLGTNEPTKIPPRPTITASSTPAPATATPLPTPTPSVVPSATPSPTPTATPTPTPTPEPVFLTSFREMYDLGRNRFTGELVEDRSVLDRRPILCKISNSPAEYVRPQAGLNSADIIFEHMTEGTITRFSALFYGETPPDIGPIRSARLIDLELVPMYDAMLCFSGASIGVTERLEADDFRSRLVRTWYPGYYRTGEDKPFEHTFYADVSRFWGYLEAEGENGRNHRPRLDSQAHFASETPIGGTPTDYLSVEYIKWTFVEWRWDVDSGKWLRWADGEEIIDKNDEQQVTANNVIVVFAAHEQDETICEHQMNDECLAGSTQIQLWEEGDAYLLRDGQRFPVQWRRDDENAMLTFHEYGTGEQIPLQIGNSWVQVVPYSYRDFVLFEESE